MIRVLQVFASLNVGGAESRMMDVFRCIDKDEFHFDFLTMQLEEQYFEQEIRSLGGNVIKIAPPRESGTLNNLKELIRIMREGNYDVVHAHTSYHCGIVMLAAKRAKVPVRISHSRTTGSKNQGVKTHIMLRLGRFLIGRYANQCLAVSKDAGEYLFGSKSFSVLPNAINLRNYEIIDYSYIATLKNTFGISDSDIVLGQVGRFEQMKNHSFTLQLFSEYYRKHPTAKLVLIGDGPLRQQYEEVAAQLECSKQIIFTGVRSDVPYWMHIFHILLVPSTYEGFPGVILEAQASGIPVLKSDGFSNATDLNLGLVCTCKLNDTEDWLNHLECNHYAPSDDQIKKAFYKKGLSIENEIHSLEEIYRSKQ